MSYLSELVASAKTVIDQALDLSELENIRIEYLGKQGHLTLQITTLRTFPPEKRPEIGENINKAKKQIIQALNLRKSELESAMMDARLTTEIIDVSLPGRRIENGNLHPITLTINRIEDFFSKRGFIVVMGPEIEDDYHNFDALNIPRCHPARTDHDTFWFDETRLLRTQTSSVQIRIMKSQQPPIRIIAPGRVYRNDYDQIHTPMFHQMEGFIVDKNISFINLKRILDDFLHDFFEKDLQISFRPSYFPFTKLSAEVDIMNKNGKWLEVLGCGMIHPNVLHNVGIDSEVYSGFAFGIGIERLTMLHYGITDLRAFFENNLLFLKQFK